MNAAIATVASPTHTGFAHGYADLHEARAQIAVGDCGAGEDLFPRDMT
jgi:hypothetical protein